MHASPLGERLVVLTLVVEARVSSFTWGCVLLLSIGNKGSILGHIYCAARGEILRPMQDELWRRRMTSVHSSIKNESMGIEVDQIPS
jgi:hypothetical protein